jgi:hypothetical protein
VRKVTAVKLSSFSLLIATFVLVDVAVDDVVAAAADTGVAAAADTGVALKLSSFSSLTTLVVDDAVNDAVACGAIAADAAVVAFMPVASAPTTCCGRTRHHVCTFFFTASLRRTAGVIYHLSILITAQTIIPVVVNVHASLLC